MLEVQSSNVEPDPRDIFLAHTASLAKRESELSAETSRLHGEALAAEQLKTQLAAAAQMQAAAVEKNKTDMADLSAQMAKQMADFQTAREQMEQDALNTKALLDQERQQMAEAKALLEQERQAAAQAFQDATLNAQSQVVNAATVIEDMLPEMVFPKSMSKVQCLITMPKVKITQK